MNAETSESLCECRSARHRSASRSCSRFRCTGTVREPVRDREGNSGSWYGVECSGTASPLISSCVIAGNGGGVDCYEGAGATLLHDTIVDNSIGLHFWLGSAYTVVSDCIFWGNVDDVFWSDPYNHGRVYVVWSYFGSMAEVLSVGLLNFSADPAFVNAAAGDYHLSAGSPCINRAAPRVSDTLDRDGVPRDATPDAGAYEWRAPMGFQFEHALNYAAGPGGSIEGSATQVVGFNSDGTTVTAVPDAGYRFVKWSDESTANPRVGTWVTTDTSVTANFATDSTFSTPASSDWSLALLAALGLGAAAHIRGRNQRTGSG